MLAASQDIDNFIERQRSQLNKQPSRQPVNRQPPSQPSHPPNNVQDRLDFKVARILDEPPPRVQSQQPYYPPSPPSFTDDFVPEQQTSFFPEQQQRRLSNQNNNDDNPAAFFNKFGGYDDKRSQLKDDLKREYNEYLQSQKRVSKSKSTSQLASPRGNTNKRVQFKQDGKVVAPWEKNDNKTIKNVQSMNDLSSTTSADYSSNRSRPQVSQHHDERYINDREEYVSELHSQIRELELRKRQLEMEGSRLPAGGSSNVTRAHYTEDLNALNSLLSERVDQRNAVDLELAHILNRPPVSASPTRVNSGGIANLNMSSDHSRRGPPQQQRHQPQQQQQQSGRYGQQNRNDNRSGPKDDGFQIGQQVDKDAEQTAKKRYQQELQAQMREAQMRKVQAKQDKDEYERKLDADIQRYNYFGRSGGGGGAPMRDKDGNVVANLADVRNPPTSQPPPQQYQQQQQQQQQYSAPGDKVYSLGSGLSSITNGPFYSAEQQQYSSNSDPPDSPSHVRGAVNNGIFGTAKTEDQISREERYKQDLKRQIDEKRQRAVEEAAKRRAEEEHEMSKHLEWQQQMDRQTAEDALRKQEKEAQERQHQQQLHEGLEKQKQQDEIITKRKPKRQEKPMTPKKVEDDDDDGGGVNRQNNYDEEQQHHHHQQQQQPKPDYRSSSPPVPTLKNKGKKQKPTVNKARRPSFDDVNQQQSPPPPPLSPLNNHDDYAEPPPIDDTDGQGRQTYRKPPTPRQPDVSSARKKPPQTYRQRPRANSNSNMPIRANSTTSLRSDGSDSEVLNRLEHLKRQLKDKEARLQEHVVLHQTGSSSHTEEQSRTTYQPPSQPPLQRKQSPGFLLNAARVHHRDSPTANDKARRILQTDDDVEFKPSYFRDDAILMGGNHGNNDGEYYSSSKRIDSADRMFATNIEKEASRRRYGANQPGFYDHEDPTNMANFELNRIAEQNELRLKKLRDLENDDASLLDSNEVLERFQQKQRLQRGGSQTTLQDDAWLK